MCHLFVNPGLLQVGLGARLLLTRRETRLSWVYGGAAAPASSDIVVASAAADFRPEAGRRPSFLLGQSGVEGVEDAKVAHD